MRILIICSGNTCRSPMAEHLLRVAAGAAGVKDLTVESAGVWAPAGQSATPQALAALHEQGIDAAGHRSRPLTKAQLTAADLVLTMTLHHKEQVLALNGQAAGKVFTFGEFLGDAEWEVADPYGGTLEAYRTTVLELEKAVLRVLGRLKSEGRIGGENPGPDGPEAGTGPENHAPGGGSFRP